MILAAMVEIYASLIRAGRRTLESLPEEYRAPVTERLNGAHEDN